MSIEISIEIIWFFISVFKHYVSCILTYIFKSILKSILSELLYFNILLLFSLTNHKG